MRPGWSLTGRGAQPERRSEGLKPGCEVSRVRAEPRRSLSSRVAQALG